MGSIGYRRVEAVPGKLSKNTGSEVEAMVKDFREDQMVLQAEVLGQGVKPESLRTRIAGAIRHLGFENELTVVMRTVEDEEGRRSKKVYIEKSIDQSQ